MADKEIIRVAIIDDHAIVRAGLRMLIEASGRMAVVGEAGNREEAFAVVARGQTDIIVLDLDIGGESSLEFIGDLLRSAGDARALVLTGLRDAEAHRRAIALGAMGVVLKEKAPGVLIKAIEKVHSGEIWLDRSATAAVLAEMARLHSKRDDPEAAHIARLTERESQIVPLVCQGLRNKQIAEALCISEATVRNHLTSILSKLNLTDRFDLALYSFRHGLAKPPQRKVQA
jgi:DNA-binding NarL/FixJ family response regulator